LNSGKLPPSSKRRRNYNVPCTNTTVYFLQRDKTPNAQGRLHVFVGRRLPPIRRAVNAPGRRQPPLARYVRSYSFGIEIDSVGTEALGDRYPDRPNAFNIYARHRVGKVKEFI
jgi:hypothetical protein